MSNEISLIINRFFTPLIVMKRNTTERTELIIAPSNFLLIIRKVELMERYNRFLGRESIFQLMFEALFAEC